MATSRIVDSLTGGDLEHVVDDARRASTVVDGAFGNPRIPWVDSLLANRTVSWYLMFLPMHMSEHLLGEALSVRGQIGRSAGA